MEKTLQSLNEQSKASQKRQKTPSIWAELGLVLVWPNFLNDSVVYLHWFYFFGRWSLNLFMFVHILQDKGILLTTYDIVRNNAKSLCGDYRYQDDGEDEDLWDYMILDEVIFL